MTVRSFASASRNGIQRGRPPKPARKPSFGPLPFFQTRDEKPFSSTVKVSGSATKYLSRYASLLRNQLTGAVARSRSIGRLSSRLRPDAAQGAAHSTVALPLQV